MKIISMTPFIQYDPIRSSLADILKNLTIALANKNLELEDYIALVSSFAEMTMSKKDWRHFSMFELLFEYAKDLAHSKLTGEDLETVLEYIAKIEHRILLNFLLSRFRPASKIPPSFYWYRVFRMLEFIFTPDEIKEIKEYIKMEQKKQAKFIKSVEKEFKKELELGLQDFGLDEEELAELADSEIEEAKKEELIKAKKEDKKPQKIVDQNIIDLIDEVSPDEL